MISLYANAEWPSSGKKGLVEIINISYYGGCIGDEIIVVILMMVVMVVVMVAVK